jgi:hypothetical protein
MRGATCRLVLDLEDRGQDFQVDVEILRIQCDLLESEYVTGAFRKLLGRSEIDVEEYDRCHLEVVTQCRQQLDVPNGPRPVAVGRTRVIARLQPAPRRSDENDDGVTSSDHLLDLPGRRPGHGRD